MKKFFAIFLVISLMLSCFCACNTNAGDVGENWVSSLESSISNTATDQEESTYEISTSNDDSDAAVDDIESIEYSDLVIKFIDVGQADAALISCGEQHMLIDGGNRSDSDILYTILKRDGVSHLDYIVCTHAHEDHCGGIAGAIEACSSIGTVYAPVTEYDSKAFGNFVSAVKAKKAEITIPNAGQAFTLGDANVAIIGPVKTYEDANNTSLVVKIAHGENSFLFTGDMEHDAEINLIESGADVSADVLKVGHHGSSTSTSYRFLREVAPAYGVISVGKDNSYGHPHEEALSRLEDADIQVFRTDLLGDIVCRSDGIKIVFDGVK